MMTIPMITDWLMVAITAVYVIATILICGANIRSAKATREQLAESKVQFGESKRQFEETKRLQCMPFLQLEIPKIPESPMFEIELSVCKDDESETYLDYSILHLKNLGNGTATNINYTWKCNANATLTIDYPPINAIMSGGEYYFQITFHTGNSSPKAEGILTFEYDDLLGHTYRQKIRLYFEENALVRCENDIPEYLGTVLYSISKKKENS